MSAATVIKRSVSFSRENWIFLTEEAARDGHENKSRIVGNALELLRRKRNRKHKYERTGK